MSLPFVVAQAKKRLRHCKSVAPDKYTNVDPTLLLKCQKSESLMMCTRCWKECTSAKSDRYLATEAGNEVYQREITCVSCYEQI